MKWLYGLLCLFFLIIFHEIGHFIAAKICGVKVESFSVGFGPILLHKKIRGTDYRISLLPLGGYCGMKGEEDFRKAVEENLPVMNTEPDSLYGVHPLKRAVIGFAGPFFNFILAIIFSSLIYAIGYEYQTYSNKIILSNELYENTSMVAQNAGIKTGDKIIKIQNKTVQHFNDIITELSILGDKDITVEVDRNGEILQFNLHTELDKETGMGKIGVAADVSDILTVYTPKMNFFQCLGSGFKDSMNVISVTFKSFRILFKGIKLTNAVSGPVRVTEMLGSSIQSGFNESAKWGFISIFNLMSVISISLFIMNLLPIPVLDGGLILVAFIEFITRRKIKPKTQYKIQFIGIAFIAILFCIALTSDITYFAQKGLNK